MKNKLFARDNYLEILQKRVDGLLEGYRQNIAIIGDELSGKTSIIFQFLNRYHNNRVVPLYLEARTETLISFVRRFSGVLLYNFLINSEIVLKEDLEFLIQRSEKYIPKTTEKIRFILAATARRKKTEIFTELLSLCELFHQETSKHCLVIFDEFQNLEALGVNDLYADWSKLLISQKNTMYIIVSSMKFKARFILSRHLSLLFGNFEVLTVDPFDMRTSEKYVDNILNSGGLDPAKKNFLINFTGGFPLYLDVICEEIKKSGQANIAQCLESQIFDSSGILNQRFSNYIKRFLDQEHSKDYISILYLISTGYNKIKDISHVLRKPLKELMPRVNHLLEVDTVARNGDFLQISDRVFGFWIKHVYQEKLDSLTFDAKNQKEQFIANIESAIREFCQEVEKPVMERMLELLRMFSDDLMQVGKKKVRLNHFREVKPLEFSRGNLRHGLIGRCDDSLWILSVNNESLTEEDVADFSRECKKFRHKQQRKIIITLKDIDDNTRLRALEEKVWAWDINNINQLFDLYSTPWVMA